MPLWWVSSPPRSREGWCCTWLANTKNTTELQEFIGSITYLSPFSPGPSTLVLPLHGLLKKDAEFSSDASYQTIFHHGKNAVVSDTTLQYFDVYCPITVQVDASEVGLGAAFLQNNKPVALASKALTEVECHYANIECEMLAVVIRPEQFRTYIYSRPFTIQSDHKPLESLTKKNLADAPAWLQHMPLHLQGYDYVLCYHPGKEMSLSDMLSCFKPKPGPEIALDIAIHHAHLSLVWKKALQLAFEMDNEMHALADIIISCWPDDIKEVPCPRCSYWQHHESVTVENGLVFCGQTLIIPPSEGRRSLVLCTNHTKALLKHSCFPMIVSSGLVSTRPLKKLFGNVKHAWDFRPRMLLHHSHQHLHFTSLADMCIRHFYIGGHGLAHPWWFLFQGNPSMQLPSRPKQLCQNHPHPGGMGLWSWHTRSPMHG